MGARWLEKKLDLQPEWELFGGGPAIVQALDKGELDLGYIGLPPSMIGISNGVQIKCIAGGHIEGTVFIARKEYYSLEDMGGDEEVFLRQFENGVIGCPPKESIHDVIIRNLLKKHGLDIEVKNFKWADFIPEAMERSEIEAAVGTPALVVVAEHIAKLAIPPSLLWPNNPSYGILASQKLIEDNPEIIEGFLKIHEEATNLMRERPREASRIISRVLDVVDDEFVLKVCRISPKYCASFSKEFIGSTLRFVPVLKDLGYIKRSLKKEDIFDQRFIEKVHPEPPHYNI
jgi:NitT/TauT family transport system substrate-binding protein